MKFPKIFKRKEKSTANGEQKRFFCENCENEVFLKMKFCDECGGEIEWPKDYDSIIKHWSKENEIKPTPVTES